MNNKTEEKLLAILLMYSDKQAYIFNKCCKEFFFDMLNRQIFELAYELFQKEEEVDNESIFVASGKNKEIGKKLVDILTFNIEVNSFSYTRYCKHLADNYINILIANAKTQEDFEHIEQIRNSVLAMSNSYMKHIAEGSENFVNSYEKMKESLVQTGFTDFDDCIGSFQGGDYIALGGSTGAGKTTVALNFTKMFCAMGKKVLYCSLEMPHEQIQKRFTSITTGIKASKFRSVSLTKDDLESCQVAMNTLKEWDLMILTDYELTIEKLRMYATEQKKQGLDFIVIDYLGLMSGYNNKSLYEKSTIISRKIKLLATSLNIPILVLVQLNRDLKNRQDKRPMLSDIRESGAIEQDADFVVFAHRPYVYTKEQKDIRKLELIVAKNRHGKSNYICDLDIDLETQEISNKKTWYSMPKI